MRQAAITTLARFQLWALNHKFPGSAALVCALDRAMGVLERWRGRIGDGLPGM